MSFQITNAAVLGADVNGGRMAVLLANAGIPVTLFQTGEQMPVTEQQLYKHLYTPALMHYICQAPLTDCSVLHGFDWVIISDAQIGADILSLAAPHLHENVIISSCAHDCAAADIEFLLPAALQPRFIGVFPYEHNNRCTLLEMVATQATDPAVTAFIRQFVHDRLGKDAVLVQDIPGFFCRRTGFFTLCSLLTLTRQAHLSCEQTDELTGTLLGRPREGLYRGIDARGIAAIGASYLNLTDRLPACEKEYFRSPNEICDIVDQAKLKSFYCQCRDADSKKTLVWNIDQQEYQPVNEQKSAFYTKAMENKRLPDRMRFLFASDAPEALLLWSHIKALFVYCAQLTEDYRLLDYVMRKGLGWTAGLFEIIDMMGAQQAIARMTQEGAALPAWVDALLQKEFAFYSAAPDTASPETVQLLTHSVLVDLGDGVLGLEIRSPGNSITKKLRLDILKAIDFVEQDNRFIGMVMFNQGAHFFTGTDVKEFYFQLQNKIYDMVDESTDEFQAVSQRLKYARKPIVSAVHGVALGGGTEFVMHSSRVVAHVDSQIGLIETRVGIMPGGGGIKELLTRTMQTAAHYQVTDVYPILEKYWMQICQARISRNAYQAKEMDYLRPTDIIVMHMDDLLPTAKREVLHMASLGFQPCTAQPIPVLGTEGYSRFCAEINKLREQGIFTEFDGVIAQKVAFAFTGGETKPGTIVSEEDILALEQQGIQFLYKTENTFARVSYATKGRVLRN